MSPRRQRCAGCGRRTRSLLRRCPSCREDARLEARLARQTGYRARPFLLVTAELFNAILSRIDALERRRR